MFEYEYVSLYFDSLSVWSIPKVFSSDQLVRLSEIWRAFDQIQMSTLNLVECDFSVQSTPRGGARMPAGGKRQV